ncbi:hypothetical protein NEDG_00838 [Nematocida displodere]|uniref:Uncharacterized protein n=1 Tax=Nematocida displodere TaxID=1805483 RepID=A0A177ECN2_9MICR|nr:hypothetical protein NEDG_00838 [Nematocida displodere]
MSEKSVGAAANPTKEHSSDHGHSGEEKIAMIKLELGPLSPTQKLAMRLLLPTLKPRIEWVINICIFFLVLIPENLEFIFVLKDYIIGPKKENSEQKSTLCTVFDVMCPILEGLVCVFHTFIFVCEVFLHIEIKYGLAIAIAASHLTCAIIIAHIEIVDSSKKNYTHATVWFLELVVAFNSVLITLCYLKTAERFPAFIMMCTIITQFLCRSLTRIVHDGHSTFRKVCNSLLFRVIIGFTFLSVILLIQILYLYFIKK